MHWATSVKIYQTLLSTPISLSTKPREFRSRCNNMADFRIWSVTYFGETAYGVTFTSKSVVPEHNAVAYVCITFRADSNYANRQ